MTDQILKTVFNEEGYCKGLYIDGKEGVSYLEVIQGSFDINGQYDGCFFKDSCGNILRYVVNGNTFKWDGKFYINDLKAIELETKPDNSSVCDMYDCNTDSDNGWGWFYLLVIVFAIGLIFLEWLST